MKTNITERKLPYFFIHRIHGRHILQNLRLALSRLRRTKVETENILRWEDDGGQINWISKIIKVSNAAHFDTFGNEILETRPYKEKEISNDSLGG